MEIKDVTLTDEMKNKLRNTLGIRVDSVFPYVPKAYRTFAMRIPKELWPVFTLKSIDGIQSTLFEDDMMGEATYSDEKVHTQINSGKVKIKICSMGIMGWKNYRDIDGILLDPPQKAGDGTLAHDSLKIIPSALMVELSNAITENSRLTAEELLGLEY